MGDASDTRVNLRGVREVGLKFTTRHKDGKEVIFVVGTNGVSFVNQVSSLFFSVCFLKTERFKTVTPGITLDVNISCNVRPLISLIVKSGRRSKHVFVGFVFLQFPFRLRRAHDNIWVFCCVDLSAVGLGMISGPSCVTTVFLQQLLFCFVVLITGFLSV